ncbi:MAG TPA: hypothetical protein VLC91_07815 [Spongiibacteraceae bacterium]|nr:hypothetical protein [Spongiibacteraceae bacterium]
MKKLWLNALTASLLLGAVSISAGAQAGDHYRGHDDRRDHGEHYRHYDRHHDDWHGHGGYRQVVYREYRPVYYRPAPVYYRPVSYYPEPVYGARVGYGGGDIHGSISVGF